MSLQKCVCNRRSTDKFGGALKAVWTVSKVQLVTTQTASALICRNKCGKFKGCIDWAETQTICLPLKSTVSIVWGFNGQTYAYFLLESSCFDKAQINSVSSIKPGEEEKETAGGEEGEAGEQKLGFATVPSGYFIDVRRHSKRAAFTLACRVLLLARESKTISDFEKYGGSWRSHSHAGISRLRAATLSALHLGGYSVAGLHLWLGHTAHRCSVCVCVC